MNELISTMSSVVTSINHPKESIVKNLELVGGRSQTILVGDVKTPSNWNDKPVIFLDIDEQKKLFPDFCKFLPENHYSRKMVGYLYSFHDFPTWLYETDDDNFHLESPHDILSRIAKYKKFRCESSSWVNLYSLFFPNHDLIWPRGFPLHLVREENFFSSEESGGIESVAVIQGVANGDPDVDAIYRLLNPNATDLVAQPETLLILNANQLFPINSQTTWWRCDTFPLLYLPVTSTFRVTDILRGVITNRILGWQNKKICAISPIDNQVRNPHNLYHDFESEVPMYINISDYVDALNSKLGASISSDVYEKLFCAYELAIHYKLCKAEELITLNGWISECKKILE